MIKNKLLNKITKLLLNEYDYVVNTKYKIKRISVFFTNVKKRKFKQLNMFSNEEDDKKENKLSNIINEVREKYRNDSILKCISLLDFATQRKRNKLIGGHNAE